jgi:hypothetical protein
MILTRSPYYINVAHPNSFVTSVDFSVHIHKKNDVSDMQIEKTYEITKFVTGAGETTTFINIAPLVSDYFENSIINTAVISNDYVSRANTGQYGAAWFVSVDVQVKDSIGSMVAPYTVFKTALNGFTSYYDGANKEVSKKILLPNPYYKAYSDRMYQIPLFRVSGDSAPTLNGASIPLTPESLQANDILQHLLIRMPNYPEGVTVAFEGENVFLEPLEECKWPVHEIQFVNRYGAVETMQFFKARKENFNVDSETFINNYYDGSSYDKLRHQKRRVNISGYGETTLETGFLYEDSHETIKDLMMSEQAWISESFGYRPININKKSIAFKTREIDKLISYSLEFEYAHNHINNV